MKNAIRMACNTISHEVNPHIEEAVKKYSLTHKLIFPFQRVSPPANFNRDTDIE